MVDVTLGERTIDEKDPSITVYESVEVAGVPNPEEISKLVADAIVAALDKKYFFEEKYASEVELVNFNIHAQTLDLSLEFKGVEINEAELISVISKAVDQIENSLKK
jgi:hypothetical protein